MYSQSPTTVAQVTVFRDRSRVAALQTLGVRDFGRKTVAQLAPRGGSPGRRIGTGSSQRGRDASRHRENRTQRQFLGSGDAGGASPRHRGRDLGHAGGQFRSLVPVDGQGRSLVESGRLLVATAGLEEPDAHTQPGRAVFLPVHQHQGRWTGRTADSTSRRRRLDHGKRGRLLANGDRGRRAGRRGQGKRRQVPDHASGLQGPCTRGPHSDGVSHISELRHPPLQPCE
jgi:hypothetical protein